MRTFATLGGALAQRNQFRTSSRPTSRGRHPAARFTTLSLVALLGVGLAACGDKDTIVGLAEIDGEKLLANADLLVVRGASQEGEVAATLDGPLVVEVRDITNAPMANVLVEWAFENGKGIGEDGTPAATVRVRTGADGQAAVFWQLDTVAGDQLATARIVRPEGPSAVDAPAGLSAAPTASTWFQQIYARGRAGALRSISIGPDNPALSVGQSIQLVARGRDKYGNLLSVQPSFTWQSSDVGVGSVDDGGLVVAAGGGVTTITASSGSVFGQETVTVTASSTPRVAAVRLDPAGATLSPGDTVRFTVSATDSVGNALPVNGVQWGTLNSTVTTVSTSGRVTALAAGNDSVWASVSGVRASRPITVTGAVQTPGRVNDLAASVIGNTVRLRWTQVSDGTGAPARYMIRYGTPSISWAAAAATEVRIPGTQVGAALEYTWTGLAAGTSYGFQIVAYRQGTTVVQGAPSNIVGATTTAVAPTVVGVDVQPNSASGAPGSALAFTATARMSDGSQQAAQVTWTATGGTSSTNGLYTAGSVTGTYRIVGRHALGYADTSAVTITAAPPPPPPPPSGPGSVLLQSAFSTARGTSTSAIGDGGKWNLIGGFGQEVVSSAGLDFPSPNVAKFVAQRSNSGFALNRTDRLPPLAVGTTRYYRWYVRMVFPDALVGNGDHPWQDGNAVSDTNWFVGVHYSTGTNGNASRPGQWQLSAYVLPSGASLAFNSGPWLNKGQTYRIEVALERISTTQYNLDVRVYDRAGTLLHDSNAFPADYGGGTLETRGPYTFKNAANLNGFNSGTNDFETDGNNWWTSTFDYSYQGGFAIRDGGGWIGAYGSVVGEN